MKGSKYWGALLSIGMTIGACQGKKDDPFERKVLELKKDSFELTAPGQTKRELYAKAVKQPVTITTTLNSGTLPDSDVAQVEAGLKALVHLQLLSDDTAVSVGTTGVKVKLTDDVVSISISRASLPWIGGDFEVKVVPGTIGTDFELTSGIQGSFSVAEIITQDVSIEPAQKSFSLRHGDLLLTQGEVTSIEAVEAEYVMALELAEAANGKFRVYESGLVGGSDAETKAKERNDVAQAMADIAAYLKCQHDCQVAVGADVAEVEASLGALVERLDVHFEQVLFPQIYHSFQFSVVGYSVDEELGLQVDAVQDGEAVKVAFSGVALSALSQNLSVGYLFHLKSGPTPSAVTDDSGTGGAPIHNITLNADTGTFKHYVSKVWLAKMYAQSPQKTSLLAIETSGPEIAFGFRLTSELSMEVAVTR